MNNNMLQVIPVPARVKVDEGVFVINGDTVITAPDLLQGIGRFLQRSLQEDSSLQLTIKNHNNNAGSIHLKVDDNMDGMGKEGYLLLIEKSQIIISGKDEEGVFRGIQTLRQLIPLSGSDPGGQVELPCLEIRDNPRFPWRGFMLDVSRHFFGIDTIKQLLDAMALLKMNVMHLHLCDDQGWRLEIEKYPRLIEIASSRPESQIGGFLSKKTDGTPHRGFFTKQQMREIISYAAERYITIVPEIEMPGHCTAALAAYPELGCTGGPYQVATFSGIKKDIYCAGKEETFSFLQDVLDEVLALFPSPWIHIGGDEAPKDRWKACPKCQARMKAQGLKDEEELQAYFVNRMIKYIEDQGRVVIGWNEILSDSLPASAVGQHWLRNKKQVLQHLRKGGKVIGSYFFRSYLDYNYGVLPLSKAYAYDPVPAELEAQFVEGVLGIEAPMWTEFAATPEHMQTFVFPRLIAVAENAWTPIAAGRDFTAFIKRLPSFLERLRCLGIAHASLKASQPHIFKRTVLWTKIFKQSSELPD